MTLHSQKKTAWQFEHYQLSLSGFLENRVQNDKSKNENNNQVYTVYKTSIF